MVLATCQVELAAPLHDGAQHHVRRACRCCGCAREDLPHFGRCAKASQIFKEFHRLTKAEKVPDDKWDRFSLFALLPGGKLPDIWIDLHLLLWKQLIALLVRVELEGEKFALGESLGPGLDQAEGKYSYSTL